MADFDIISYLSGLTLFTFDRAHLQRVALDCGVADIADYGEMTEELRDKCEIELLKLVVYGPYSSSSFTDKHGDFQKQTGSYTLTSTQLEQAKARLRRLLNKYDMTEDVEELEDSGGCMQWINEFD